MVVYRRSWDTQAMSSEAVTKLSLRLSVTCNGDVCDSDMYGGHAEVTGCQNRGEDSPGHHHQSVPHNVVTVAIGVVAGPIRTEY